MKVSLLLTTLLPLLSLCCMHDKMVFTVQKISDPDAPTESSGRMLAVAERENIRIAVYYYVDDAPDHISDKIKTQIVPAAVGYYQSTLKVDRLTSLLKVHEDVSTSCGNGNIPPPELAEGIDADLVLFVTGYTDTTVNTKANSRPCVLYNPSDRPILGVLNFNYASDWNKTDDLTYSMDVLTTMHEMTHVLGFSPSLFENFVDVNTGNKLSDPVSTKVVNGIEITVLDLAPLTSRIRAYYGCDSIPGAYLENQGAAGSKGTHFERRIFFDEFMTAQEDEDQRVTEFTLALLEGTGWYTPDYSMADPMYWGKGKGCDFHDTTCMTSATTARFEEFCGSVDTDGCSYSGKSHGYCGTVDNQFNTSMPSEFNYFSDWLLVDDHYADNCPYFLSYTDGSCQDPTNYQKRNINGESYGNNSMCFSGTIKRKQASSAVQQYCFEQTCTQTGTNSYSLSILVGNTSVVCPKAGDVSVEGYEGTITCPDPNTFCSTKALKFCPRNCMGRGSCVNGECACEPGFYGVGCMYRTEWAPLEGAPPQKSNPFGNNKFLNPLAIVIGLAIMVIVMLIGSLAKGITTYKERLAERNNGYAVPRRNKGGDKFDGPGKMEVADSGPESPQIFGSIEMNTNFGMQTQAQLSHGEALRQDALRGYFDPLSQGGVRVEGVGENVNNGGRQIGNADILTVLRGAKTSDPIIL